MMHDEADAAVERIPKGASELRLIDDSPRCDRLSTAFITATNVKNKSLCWDCMFAPKYSWIYTMTPYSTFPAVDEDGWLLHKHFCR